MCACVLRGDKNNIDLCRESRPKLLGVIPKHEQSGCLCECLFVFCFVCLVGFFLKWKILEKPKPFRQKILMKFMSRRA